MAVVWAVVGVGIAATALPALGEPPADVRAYAVFGLAGTSIGSRSRVQGDVGSLGDAIALGNGTRVSGLAAAPAIRLRKHARAAAGYFCSSIEGTPEACAALPSSFVGAPAIVLVSAGTLKISAPPRSKSPNPLAPGTYGELTVGTAAELVLAGGSYAFDSIAVGSRAKVLCASACDIAVAGAVTMRAASRLGAADTVAPNAVTIRIAAHAAATALDAASRAIIQGSIYAPTGDVRIAAAAKVTGGIVGHGVSVGPRARLTGPGAG